MAVAGDLLRFLSLIAPAQGTTAASPAQAYCEKALWYLEGRYDRDVSIQEAADFVGISRSHLYRLMMDVYGCSPKAKLLQIRMRHAPPASVVHHTDAGGYRASYRPPNRYTARYGIPRLPRRQPPAYSEVKRFPITNHFLEDHHERLLHWSGHWRHEMRRASGFCRQWDFDQKQASI